MDHSRQKPFQTTRFIYGVSLVAMLAGWGLYAYLFHQVSLIGNETVALTNESAKLEAEQSKETELKNDLAANKARQPVLNSYFVDATDPVPLFETFEGYGRDTNVSVTIDSVDIKKSPSRLVVSITGDGNFADVYRFIALLEAAPYEFSVTSASVRTSAPSAKPVAAVTASKTGAQSATAAATPAPTAAVWEAKLTLSITSVTGIVSPPASAAKK